MPKDNPDEKKKSKKKEKPPLEIPSGSAPANPFEKWTEVTLHRTDINKAPYNPRGITDQAYQRLLTGIQRVGLVAPITVNVRTMNIVGGHQRIRSLDDLHHHEGVGKDYNLRVALIDVDEKTEMELNVFLNNVETQGYYDAELLSKMYSEYKIGYAESGFSAADIVNMFGQDPAIAQPEMLVEIAEKVRAAQELFDKLLMTRDTRDDNNPNFYDRVIFEDVDTRMKFHEVLGLPQVDQNIDGRDLIRLLGPDGLGSHDNMDVYLGKYLHALVHKILQQPEEEREEALDRQIKVLIDRAEELLANSIETIRTQDREDREAYVKTKEADKRRAQKAAQLEDDATATDDDPPPPRRRKKNARPAAPAKDEESRP